MGHEIAKDDDVAANESNIKHSIGRLTERLTRIQKDYQASKDMLHGWIAEQHRLLDEEERQIRCQDEAIDVECGEPTDKSAVCADDETAFNALIAAADRLLSEKK